MGLLDVLPWRRQPEQKLDFTEALLLPLQMSGPSFSRSYAQAVANSYEMNSVAHRAIRLIAENVAAVPWMMYDGDDPVDRHWVLDSLRKPNRSTSGRMFKQILAGDMVAAGEAFILKIQPRAEMPAELHALRPDHMKVNRPERMGDPVSYEYRPPGGDPVIYDDTEVLHIHSLDLLRTGRGFSSLYAAALDLDQSNLSGKWNVSLLKNGGRPSMAVIAKQRLSPEQKQMLKDSVEALHGGAGNAGRVAVFSGAEMEVRDLGFSPKDMDWREGIQEVNARIATALGVPPEMLNLGNEAYQNKPEAKKSMYEDTIVPLFNTISEALDGWMVPTPFNLRGYWEKVEALQPNRTEEYERLDKAVTAGWLTINDARQEAGYEPDDTFGNLYRWQADAISKFGRMSDEEPGPDQMSGATIPRGLKARPTDEDEKVVFWKAQDQRKRSFEAALAEDLAGAFDKERQAIQEKFLGIGSVQDMADAAVSAVEPERIMDVLEPAFLAVMEDFGDATLTDLGVKSMNHKAAFDDIFGDYVNEVLSFTSTNVGNSVKQIDDTTKQKLREHISAGVEEGLSVPAIAKRIDDLYLNQIIPNRSTVIARTEVIRASNAGSFHSAKGTGLPVLKSWLATRDDRTRPEHLAAEMDPVNQGIPLDATFEVGGEYLDYPGDPSGSAWNVIMCRCTSIHEIDTSGASEGDGLPAEDPYAEDPSLPAYEQKRRVVRRELATHEKQYDDMVRQRTELARFQDEAHERWRQASGPAREAVGEEITRATNDILRINKELQSVEGEARKAVHKALKKTVDKKATFSAAGGRLPSHREYRDFISYDRVAVKGRTHVDSGLKWVNQHMDEAGAGVRNRSIGFSLDPDPRARAFALPERGQIAVSTKKNIPTVVHEIGHVIENTNPEIRATANNWIASRTRGESVRKMSEVTKNSAYHASEVTRPDKFFNAYVGRDYGDGYTEVVSMGMEWMYKNPMELARKDPEHFDLILSFLNGTFRESPFYKVP